MKKAREEYLALIGVRIGCPFSKKKIVFQSISWYLLKAYAAFRSHYK
jgi:hypothetical protein